MNRKARRRAAAAHSHDRVLVDIPLRKLSYVDDDIFRDPGVVHCMRCGLVVKTFFMLNDHYCFCQKCFAEVTRG